MSTAQDFTPKGLKLQGPYENDRNSEHADTYKAIIREAYGVQDVICAHHLVYVKVEKRDGFDFQVVEEVPSADTLIFDHDVALKIWGDDDFQKNLIALALEPIATRDALLTELYNNRSK